MKGIKLDFFEERVKVKRPRTRLAMKWQKYVEEDTSETPLEQSIQTKKKKNLQITTILTDIEWWSRGEEGKYTVKRSPVDDCSVARRRHKT